MELVSADNDGCTVRFTRLEYADLMSIVQVARMDYSKLSQAVLNLSLELVSKIEKDIYDIAAQNRSIRKYGK